MIKRVRGKALFLWRFREPGVRTAQIRLPGLYAAIGIPKINNKTGLFDSVPFSLVVWSQFHQHIR